MQFLLRNFLLLALFSLSLISTASIAENKDKIVPLCHRKFEEIEVEKVTEAPAQAAEEESDSDFSDILLTGESEAQEAEGEAKEDDISWRSSLLHRHTPMPHGAASIQSGQRLTFDEISEMGLFKSYPDVKKQKKRSVSSAFNLPSSDSESSAHSRQSGSSLKSSSSRLSEASASKKRTFAPRAMVTEFDLHDD